MYQVWIFLCGEKVVFCSQDIQIFVLLINPQTSKSATSSNTLLHVTSYTFDLFFKMLGSIKMKYDPILLQLMIKISNSILVLLWKLETSSRLFYHFEKIAIWYVLLIFIRWYLTFLAVSVHTFIRVKNQKFIIIDFGLIVVVGWKIEKQLGPSPPNHSKSTLKILLITISVSWPNFITKWSTIQKIYSKLYPVSSTNTHHEVKIFEVDGMV